MLAQNIAVGTASPMGHIAPHSRSRYGASYYIGIPSRALTFQRSSRVLGMLTLLAQIRVIVIVIIRR